MAEKVTALKNAIFIATGFETAREQIHFWNFSFSESQKAMTGKRKIKKGLKWLKSSDGKVNFRKDENSYARSLKEARKRNRKEHFYNFSKFSVGLNLFWLWVWKHVFNPSMHLNQKLNQCLKIDSHKSKQSLKNKLIILKRDGKWQNTITDFYLVTHRNKSNIGFYI